MERIWVPGTCRSPLGFLAGKLELEIGTQLPLWPRKAIFILLCCTDVAKKKQKKGRCNRYRL